MTRPRIVPLMCGAIAMLAAACTPEVAKVDEKTKAAAAAAETSPAMYHGVALVAQVCAQCHDVGLGTKPELASAAPAFADVANRPETTAESLTQWMRSAKHPSMPHYMFNAEEVGDLATYILSLKKAN